MTFQIVKRSQWGARSPKRTPVPIEMPTAEVWLHHTAGALDAGGNGVWWDDMRGIQNFHMDSRGWNDIAYNFVIGGGQIFEGRGVGIRSGATKGRNSYSHSICVVGNYETMEPTEADLHAIARLLRHGREQRWWHELTGPHRDAPGASTACCGRNLISKIPELRRLAAPRQEEDRMDPIALVLNTYMAQLGRLPESLQVIDQHRRFIEANGEHAFVNGVANSDEAKAYRPKLKRALSIKAPDDDAIVRAVRDALGDSLED